MPGWTTFIVKQDELDLTPPGGGQWTLPSQKELVAAHDGGDDREVAREILHELTGTATNGAVT